MKSAVTFLHSSLTFVFAMKGEHTSKSQCFPVMFLIKDDMFSREAEVQQDQEDLKNTHTSPLKWLPLSPSQGNIIPDKTL